MPRGMPTKTSFKKGVKKNPNSGRKKGQRNRVTMALKDAILEAAAMVGNDGRGRDGLLGYLRMLAVKERKVYARLIERVLPLHVHVKDKTDKLTPQEAVDRLMERGIPVPPSLNSLAALSSPTSMTIEHDALEAELNGLGPHNNEIEGDGEDDEEE